MPKRMHAFAVPSCPKPMGCFRQLLEAVVAPKPHLHTPASRSAPPVNLFLSLSLSVSFSRLLVSLPRLASRLRFLSPAHSRTTRPPQEAEGEGGIRGGIPHSTKGAQQPLSMGTLDPCRQPWETKSPLPWRHADVVAKDGRKRQAMEGQAKPDLPIGECCMYKSRRRRRGGAKESRSNGKREEMGR